MSAIEIRHLLESGKGQKLIRYVAEEYRSGSGNWKNDPKSA